ncbi:MAG: DUF3134 domain-containing protein [Cyanothece sp. SIO1E1]|nr:DUF3134 domain-containing protein [Cyanothece sp. SIO1E1]
MYNPSLREQPRKQPAAVIPLQQESSILGWLEGTGRLMARDVKESDTADEEDITALMVGEDNDFDNDDDDDDDLDLDE